MSVSEPYFSGSFRFSRGFAGAPADQQLGIDQMGLFRMPAQQQILDDQEKAYGGIRCIFRLPEPSGPSITMR